MYNCRTICSRLLHPNRLLLSARPLARLLPSSPFPTTTRNYSIDFRNLTPETNFDEIDPNTEFGDVTPDTDVRTKLDFIALHILRHNREHLPAEPDELIGSKEVKEAEYYEIDTSDDDEPAFDTFVARVDKYSDPYLKLRHEMLQNRRKNGSISRAYECLKKMEKLQEKIFLPRMEDKVIMELVNRLKVAEGKEKFLLQMKLNRALRMVEHREAFDPNKPANYGVIQNQQARFREEDEMAAQAEEEEFDDMKEKDTVLLKKLSELDKQLEKKLAELDHTFGKKGKLLEEEIRDLAEERNSLTEQKRQPLYRKGFDVKLIDVNRTCKVTKGGQIAKYTVMVACGNYNGALGFAKAKGLTMRVALQKAHEKCFQNIHYIERHEEHTIAHAIETKFKKTKVRLWPASAQTGIVAGKTVKTILPFSWFRGYESKVIGSRNPHIPQSQLSLRLYMRLKLPKIFRISLVDV